MAKKNKGESASDLGVDGATGNVRGGASDMELTSPIFEPGDAFPMNPTADGAELAPASSWSGVPAGTKS